MTFRSALVSIVSLALGFAVLAVLISKSGTGLDEVLSGFVAMNWAACLRLVGLIVVNTFLSSLKWRFTDRAMCHESDVSPSQFECFALSSIGTALGQILPAQFSMAIARTLGIRVHGRAFQRGTLGSLFEQSFDVFFCCFLVVPSAAIYLLNLRSGMWLILAVACAVIAIFSAGATLGLTRYFLARVLHQGMYPSGWRRVAARISGSGLLQPSLGRKVMFLSGLRFVIFVLIAEQVSLAVHARIQLWQLAMAMPFGVLATASGITPGGLGLTEFTFAAVLKRLGTPLAASTQWAVANRLLVAGGSIGVAIVVLLVFLLSRPALDRTTAGSTIQSAKFKDAHSQS